MARCRNLPQRPWAVAPFAVSDYRRGASCGSVQGNPVLGILGRPPHLLAALDRLVAPVARQLDAVPITGDRQAVDETDKAVQIAGLDEGGQGIFIHRLAR